MILRPKWLADPCSELVVVLPQHAPLPARAISCSSITQISADRAPSPEQAGRLERPTLTRAHRCLQRDAQVLDRMLALAEDWARGLPQPQFADALHAALAAGTRLPPRPEAAKAPVLDEADYAAQRQAQARQQSSLRQRFGSASGRRGRGGGAGGGSEYDQLGASPDSGGRVRRCAALRDLPLALCLPILPRCSSCCVRLCLLLVWGWPVCICIALRSAATVKYEEKVVPVLVPVPRRCYCS
jgi:hypothetical protein